MRGGKVNSRIRAHASSTHVLLVLSIAMIALALLAVTSSSRADDVPAATRFAVGSPAMQVALGIAQANWGMEACNGQATVEWGVDAANINARSFWANPLSSYDNAAQNTQCRIVFNSTMTFSWEKFCTVLVHEYGHLTGHPHTVDGPDVMSPIYRAPLPACTNADPSEPPPPAPAPAVTPTPTPIDGTAAPTPDAALRDAPRARTNKRLRAKAAKRGGENARPKARSRSRAKARMAAHRLIQFSDADAEPRPWTPFAYDV
jgi:hypothetical protein